MGFFGGDLRENFIGKIRGADPGNLLAVPIDVGKNSAAALVCDFWGEIIIPPFVFDFNERGFQDFAVAVARAEAERAAGWARVGLEQAGHYHRPLQARLEGSGFVTSQPHCLRGSLPAGGAGSHMSSETSTAVPSPRPKVARSSPSATRSPLNSAKGAAPSAWIAHRHDGRAGEARSRRALRQPARSNPRLCPL
jgi:hypothetical protein